MSNLVFLPVAVLMGFKNRYINKIIKNKNMTVVSNLVNGVNCGFPLTFSVLVTLITQGLCVTQPRMRTLVVRCMQIVNPVSSGCGAIDTEGTSVGRAAAEVCGSLEAGVCRPGVVSLFDSGPSVEEAPLHIPNSAPMLNTQHYHYNC